MIAISTFLGTDDGYGIYNSFTEVHIKADTLSMGGNCSNLFQWLYTSQNTTKITYAIKAYQSMFSIHRTIYSIYRTVWND